MPTNQIMLFTVFTTACNRPEELKRLYASLLRQTYKDFVWLIVDDSTDNRVKQVVEELMEEGAVRIDYHKQEHRGRYWAQKTGFGLVETPYMVDIDDDDELTYDCLEILAQEWKRIEEEGRSNIGVVCGLCVDKDGKALSYHDDRPYFDTDYIQMEWTKKHPSEHLQSRKLEVIKEVDIFNNDGKWLADEVSFVRESVLWNRVARRYQSRYVNRPMRVYHTDSSQRLSVPVFGRQKCIDYTFSNYVMLNELGDRLWENPKDAVKYLAEYLACGAALRYSLMTLLSHLDHRTLKVLGVTLWPAALIVGVCFRKNNRTQILTI